MCIRIRINVGLFYILHYHELFHSYGQEQNRLQTAVAYSASGDSQDFLAVLA